MKTRKKTSIFRHAFLMVKRTLKSYALLSVTILLSFSLLLGYLVYTDSRLYNKYCELFSQPRELVIAYDAFGTLDQVRPVLLEKAAATGNTHCMTIFHMSGNMTTYSENVSSYVSYDLYGIPDHAWGVYDIIGFQPMEITWFDGKEHSDITLAPGEALMSEGVFYALGLDQQENPQFTVQVALEDGNSFGNTFYNISARIVGTIHDSVPLTGCTDGAYTEEGNEAYRMTVVMSQSILNRQNIKGAFGYTIHAFYTDSPEEIDQLAKQLGYQTKAVYEQQSQALQTIRLEKRNKALITCALLILLGVNLYSSFSNALNNRKYEIGVKRAIGASAWSIVRQFLYESVLVMLSNILVSIALVTDVLIAYKFYLKFFPDKWGNYNEFILYVSPYSIGMFAACAVTLTVVFSLIFAYQSTQVEIVQYLKAE